ncbi:MAG: UDP-N-acetylmuramoyl-tripeptide--D-alanyl-D-alanine ligase [Oscillospiraceae bacterium]|nr:UDP-N-acetylmuramoyl-tripeptide--D-alanyl-D-alanine ligase [Oscillospiraceae bacterium]
MVWLCIGLLGAAHLLVQARYFCHMLQLNSYRLSRFFRWCAANPGALPGWRAYGALRRGDKKPFVVTARVRRLFVVITLLILAFLFGVWCSPWGLLLLLVPWAFVSAAALLCAPVEALLRAGYTAGAKRRLDSVRPTVIGVTGSFGKTSVKNFLHTLLSIKYNTLMTPESYNTPMGVVRTVREQLRDTHEMFIVEMGARQTGDIAALCKLTNPRYGVLTAIGEQHLETFHTLDNIVRTKFELIDALPADGIAFLNTDNARIAARPVFNVRAVTYGTGENAHYRAADIAADLTGCAFTVTAPDGEHARFVTPLLGAHNIVNLTGCVAVAHELGIPFADMAFPVRHLKPVPHRLQLLPGGFIDDAYNANPAGFRTALDVLASFDATRVLVTPGMVELGGRQEALNRELGAYAAPRCDWAVLVGERQAPPLREGLLEAGFDKDHLYVAQHLQDALAFIKTIDPARRIVLLENDLPDNY